MKKVEIYKGAKLIFSGTLKEASKYLGKNEKYLSIILTRKSSNKTDYDIFVDGKVIPKYVRKRYTDKIFEGMTFNFKNKQCIVKLITGINSSGNVLVDVLIGNEVDVFPFRILPTLNGLYQKIKRRWGK